MEEKDFINSWIEKLSGDYLKKFPEDFLPEIEIEEMEMPGKTLLLGSELFGTYEIIDTDKVLFYHAADINIAKYILYANRKNKNKIPFIKDEKKRSEIVKKYEKYLDDLMMEIIKDYQEKFSSSKKFFEASNKIFNSQNLQRY